jgi:DNA polymerase-3 subunit beta
MDNTIEGKHDFIINHETATVLRDNIIDKEAIVNIAFNETNIQFVIGDITVISRLIDGKYPNYKAVFPTDNNIECVVDRKELMNTVKRTSIFANQATRQLRFALDYKGIHISSEDLDFNNQSSEHIACEDKKGEVFEIGFSGRMLSKLLENMDGDKVKMLMSQPNRAALINDNEEVEGLTTINLIMPVMLNNG